MSFPTIWSQGQSYLKLLYEQPQLRVQLNLQEKLPHPPPRPRGPKPKPPKGQKLRNAQHYKKFLETEEVTMYLGTKNNMKIVYLI